MTDTASRSQTAEQAKALADELAHCPLLKRVPAVGDFLLDESKVALILSALRALSQTDTTESA